MEDVLVNNYYKISRGGSKMPYIKPRAGSPIKIFLSTQWGEALTVSILGGIFRTFISLLFVKTCVFVSETLYPFTYPFFHAPIHSWIPTVVLESNPIYEIIFSLIFGLLIYYFEKNIFYRIFHLALKAAFAALAACVFVFVIGLFSSFLHLPVINATDLPALFIYHYLTLLPLFLFCDLIRRRIFLLP